MPFPSASHALAALFFILALTISPAYCADADLDCVICTGLVDVIDQLLVIHPEPVVQFVMDQFCKLFSNELRDVCNEFVTIYGPSIIAGLESFENADAICHSMNLCADSNCKLFPTSGDADYAEFVATQRRYSLRNVQQHLSSSSSESTQQSSAQEIIDLAGAYVDAATSSDDGKPRHDLRALLETLKHRMDPSWKRYWAPSPRDSPWDWILELIDRLASYHLPLVDVDGDHMSLSKGLRGSNWRGKDCNDLDATIYPGRKVNVKSGDPNIDHDCNGIYGTSPSGEAFEKMFCDDSGQMGVITVGDSGGAHFSIPARYLTASLINNHTYHDLMYVISDEFDFPQDSGYTGFRPVSTVGPVRSIYKRFVELNHCNHRDYQNLAVNGADSNTTILNVQSLTRNSTLDHPVMLFLELIGNDVCDPAHDFSVMTQPHVYHDNMIKILDYINTTVPEGSHVWIFGLVDGRVLYNNLYNRTHPLGVTYARFYDFLNCNYANPCWVWLNTNETVRNTGSARAAELSAQAREIARKRSTYYKNFDLTYYDFPASEILNDWIKRGLDPYLLIEPVDGFHPNQQFHALLSDWIWGQMEKNHPSWIPKKNKFNVLIKKIFGNQGGY